MKKLTLLVLIIIGFSVNIFSQQITKELTIPIKGMENFTFGQHVKTIQLDDSTFLLVTHCMDNATLQKDINHQPIFFKIRNSNSGFKILWRSKQYLDTTFSAIFGDLVVQDGKYKAVFLYQKVKYFNYPASSPFYPFFIDINEETGEMIDSIGYLDSWQTDKLDPNSKLCYIGNYNRSPNIKYNGNEMIISTPQSYKDSSFLFNKTITRNGELQKLEKVSVNYDDPPKVFFDDDNNVFRYKNDICYHNVYYYKNSKLLWENTLAYTDSDLDQARTATSYLKGSGFSNSNFCIFVSQRDITRPLDRVFAGIYNSSGQIKIDTIETNDIQFCREFATSDNNGLYYLGGYNNSLYPKRSFQVEQYKGNNKKSIVWNNDSLGKNIEEVFPLKDDKVLAIGVMYNYNSQLQIWEKAAFYLAEIDFSKENGVEENAETTNVDIWPNPAGDFITITLKPSEGLEPSEGSEIHIYNTIGEKVMSESIHPMTASHRMNIESLPKGIYFVKVGSETAKFVKL